MDEETMRGYALEESLRWADMARDYQAYGSWELPLKCGCVIRSSGEDDYCPLAEALYDAWAAEPTTANFLALEDHQCTEER